MHTSITQTLNLFKMLKKKKKCFDYIVPNGQLIFFVDLTKAFHCVTAVNLQHLGRTSDYRPIHSLVHYVTPMQLFKNENFSH